MLYLCYIIRNWYPPAPLVPDPLVSILEPGHFRFDASSEIFEDAVGAPISRFVGESGVPEIPEWAARRLASYLESYPAEEDILFARCCTFEYDAILSLCNAWAELRASGTERMA